MAGGINFTNEPKGLGPNEPKGLGIKVPHGRRVKKSGKVASTEATAPPAPAQAPATPGRLTATEQAERTESSPESTLAAMDGPAIAQPPPTPEQLAANQPLAGPTSDALARWFTTLPLFIAIPTLPLYGIIYGIKGLSAARQGRPAAKRASIVGLALGTTVIVGLAISLGAAILAPGTSLGVDRLQTGDCVLQSGLSGGEVARVRAIDCSDPHYGQVFYTGELPAGPYPSDNEVFGMVDEACLAQADRVVLRDSDPDGYLFSLSPTADGWRTGDRGYSCLVVGDDDTSFSRSVVEGA